MRRRQVHLDFHTSEKIDGIGPAKAKRLLGALGSFTAVKKASEQELLAVKGISKADAAKIYQYFNSKR